MNWDRIEGNWKQAKGKLKEQWGKLTDDDIDAESQRYAEQTGHSVASITHRNPFHTP